MLPESPDIWKSILLAQQIVNNQLTNNQSEKLYTLKELTYYVGIAFCDGAITGIDLSSIRNLFAKNKNRLVKEYVDKYIEKFLKTL